VSVDRFNCLCIDVRCSFCLMWWMLVRVCFLLCVCSSCLVIFVVVIDFMSVVMLFLVMICD